MFFDGLDFDASMKTAIALVGSYTVSFERGRAYAYLQNSVCKHKLSRRDREQVFWERKRDGHTEPSKSGRFRLISYPIRVPSDN